MPGHGHDVQGRFMPIDTTEVSGSSNGAAHIAAQFQKPESDCQCCGSSSCRSARCSREVPRVVAGLSDFVERLNIPGKFGNVRFSHYHRTFGPQSGNGRGIFVGHVVHNVLIHTSCEGLLVWNASLMRTASRVAVRARPRASISSAAFAWSRACSSFTVRKAWI